ncbi:MAG: hypothetical protein JWM91_4824 [Rhodospirillales bacterium]|nr:hypothetical protein [Rhodospirillales bacterium]
MVNAEPVTKLDSVFVGLGSAVLTVAFQKKSESGIKTPKADVDLIEHRLKAVLERYQDDERN